MKTVNKIQEILKDLNEVERLSEILTAINKTIDKYQRKLEFPPTKFRSIKKELNNQLMIKHSLINEVTRLSDMVLKEVELINVEKEYEDLMFRVNIKKEKDILWSDINEKKDLIKKLKEEINEVIK